MKILYHSCHSILEFEEVSLLHEAGYDVFSPGAYLDPTKAGDNMRPGIQGLTYDKDDVRQYHRICAKHPGRDGKDFLTPEFIDRFDTIIVMHSPKWISRNWQKIKHKRVIWRTIGQSISPVEKGLEKCRAEGMEIVRYSPKESTIPYYIGEDAMIRFYKDPEQYKGWTGENKRIITFGQHMRNRGVACNFPFFESVTRPFARHLFGPGDEEVGDWASGQVPYEQLKQELRDNRAYFYTGTHPASYTLNFMEAWMTGIPIVALGPGRGNARYFPGHELYEIGDLIQNGVNGFCSDKTQELRDYIFALFEDDELAKKISEEGRKSAIHHFGKDMILESWRSYLG